ncbi:MAG TPA: restriction endonuclease [Salinarimonas sp.]|nr:restriction endonuclease [Salinarimonas sp.]
MGRAQRVKGHSFERWVANFFKALGYADAKRGIGQARSAGEVADVEGVPGIWVECKRGKRTHPREALEQAIEAGGHTGRMPVAICKDDRGPVTATMLLGDFAWLLDRGGWDEL